MSFGIQVPWRWAQIDARGFFQSEVGVTDPESVSLWESPRDVAEYAQVMADEVTTPLPAGVTR